MTKRTWTLIIIVTQAVLNAVGHALSPRKKRM
jgi:hypothetical protein